MIRSSNEANTSYAVAASLSELELKKILIDKMEANKLIDKIDIQKNLYKALVDAYEADKDILDAYGDTVTIKRHRDDADDDQPEEEAHPHPDWFQQPSRLPSPDRDWNKTVPADHGPVQPWLSNLARQEDPRESFDELMDTPLDFSAFMMNRLKVDTLTPELLAGPTFELMKGTCKSLRYLHDLRKPLPLIPNSRGRQVIPFAHFINNDLAYLSGGVSSRTYSTSVTKTKAADYGNIKWIEDLVPSSIWSEVPVSYDKESAKDVYSRRRIIAFMKYQIVEWHGYKHLDWITVRRADDKGIKPSNAVPLDDFRTALDDRLKGIRMEYLPKTIWRQSDRELCNSHDSGD
ncbi:hypothetical protein Tco_0849975 [Tanacetum coccineum]